MLALASCLALLAASAAPIGLAKPIPAAAASAGTSSLVPDSPLTAVKTFTSAGSTYVDYVGGTRTFTIAERATAAASSSSSSSTSVSSVPPSSAMSSLVPDSPLTAVTTFTSAGSTYVDYVGGTRTFTIAKQGAAATSAA